jgi:hypothetical protein
MGKTPDQDFKFLTPGPGEGILAAHWGGQNTPAYDEVHDALTAARAAVRKLLAKEHAVSAGLDAALRRSIAEVADGGVMNAIDVLFDELDDDETEELVGRIRCHLGLPDVTIEKATVEVPEAPLTSSLDFVAIRAAIAEDLGIPPIWITVLDVSDRSLSSGSSDGILGRLFRRGGSWRMGGLGRPVHGAERGPGRARTRKRVHPDLPSPYSERNPGGSGPASPARPPGPGPDNRPE